jgi:hypothetical protein
LGNYEDFTLPHLFRRTPMGLFLALGSVKFTVPWDYFPRFLYNSHQTPSDSGAGLIGVRWSPMGLMLLNVI